MIYARSPYYVSVTTTDDFVEVELEIYEGTQTTDRATGTFKTYNLIAKQTNGRVDVDVSQYIADFIDDEYSGSLSAHTGGACWVDYRTRTFDTGQTPSAWSAYTQNFATLGWLYKREGKNATITNNDVLISEQTTLYIPDGERVRMPLNQKSADNFAEFTHPTGGIDDQFTWNSTLIVESVDIIDYVEDDGLAAYDEINHGGLPSTYGGNHTTFIERVTEYAHDPKKIVFRNKFGALQEMWFFGRTIVSDNFQNNVYNTRAIDSSGNINLETRTKVVFDKIGNERITLNSGWQKEHNNELFRQLFASHDIWLHYKDLLDETERVYPVNITDASITHKTSRFDRMINYTINFEFAFDLIQ